MKGHFRRLVTGKHRFGQRRSGEAVDAEFEHHVEESIDLLVEQGMERDCARREALRRECQVGRVEDWSRWPTGFLSVGGVGKACQPPLLRGSLEAIPDVREHTRQYTDSGVISQRLLSENRFRKLFCVGDLRRDFSASTGDTAEGSPLPQSRPPTSTTVVSACSP